MYAKYAELKGWKVEVISESEGTAGGYREVVAEVKGRGVFARTFCASGKPGRVSPVGNGCLTRRLPAIYDPSIASCSAQVLPSHDLP